MLWRVLNCDGFWSACGPPRSARPPRHHPVAVLVELRDPRVPVAIADVDVVVGVESDIGRSAEVPVDVHWRRCPVSTDRYVIVRFVRSLRAATEIERYITSGVEPYRRMRSLVDDPQVVKAVVAKAVTIGKPVHALPDFADELT
jgi:hypothetical protein